MSDAENELWRMIRPVLLAPVYTAAGYVAYRTGRWLVDYERKRLSEIESEKDLAQRALEAIEKPNQGRRWPRWRNGN